MSVWPVAIRVVLSVALVLNGIGGAAAAARMHLAQPAIADAGADTQKSEASKPCHEGMTTAIDPTTHDELGQKPETPHKSPDTPDCCKGGVCSCACMSMAQALLMQPALPDALWAPVPVVQTLSLGHANPALPHLVRPPIG